MRKYVLTVAASLLLGALAVQPQAPDGTGGGKTPAGKAGPDAVVATLVNTVCASCHTLDRVNNKKGDNAAWTTTVTNMQGKGAAVTDEQVPLLVEYLVRTAGNFTVTVTAPDGAAKGRWQG
jgi:mono/diheme cytochrome c family protein